MQEEEQEKDSDYIEEADSDDIDSLEATPPRKPRKADKGGKAGQKGRAGKDRYQDTNDMESLEATPPRKRHKSRKQARAAKSPEADSDDLESLEVTPPRKVSKGGKKAKRNDKDTDNAPKPKKKLLYKMSPKVEEELFQWYRINTMLWKMASPHYHRTDKKDELIAAKAEELSQEHDTHITASQIKGWYKDSWDA